MYNFKFNKCFAPYRRLNLSDTRKNYEEVFREAVFREIKNSKKTHSGKINQRKTFKPNKKSDRVRKEF